MKCFVCKKGYMTPYFIKKRGCECIDEEFERCSNCGLVINKTLYEMTAKEWEEVNYIYHDGYQGTDENADDPKWLSRLKSQAEVFAGLFDCGIFSENMRTVDYGCGDGKLSQYVDDAFELRTGHRPSHQLIGKYEKYMALDGIVGYYTEADITPNSFDVVISCSVIEHLIGIEEIDKFFSLAKDNGTVCLHTLICEEVPRDPERFYLTPEGHCTIWTNAAMKIIYEEYGYVGCAYNLEAQMWFFFRDTDEFAKLKELHDRIKGSWTISEKFVDYWKQLPYRK